jgi:hypothetical protein
MQRGVILMKKAQVHMTETVAVIFIFFVLILFGAIFYTNFQKVAFKEKQQELLAARAIDTTTKTLFLPEFACTNKGAEPEPNCLDMMKVRQIKPLFKKFNQTYFELFSFSKITLKQTYPKPFEIVLYDQIPEKWENKKPTFFVVALKDERVSPRFYGYGHMVVEVYS